MTNTKEFLLCKRSVLATTLFAFVLACILAVGLMPGTAQAAPQTAPNPSHVIQPGELVGKWSPDKNADQPRFIEFYYKDGKFTYYYYYYYQMVYGPGTGGTKDKKVEFEYNHGYVALQGNHGTCDCFNMAGSRAYKSLYVSDPASGKIYDQESGETWYYVGKAGKWRSWLGDATQPSCYEATTGATVAGKTQIDGTCNQQCAPAVEIGNLCASNIGCMNALLSATAYKTPQVNVTSCGLYLGTSTSTMQKCNTESVGSATNKYRDGKSFDIWYDLNDELNIRLFSGTTYYYQFYCVSDGVEYRSGVASFTTR